MDVLSDTTWKGCPETFYLSDPGRLRWIRSAPQGKFARVLHRMRVQHPRQQRQESLIKKCTSHFSAAHNLNGNQLQPGRQRSNLLLCRESTFGRKVSRLYLI